MSEVQDEVTFMGVEHRGGPNRKIGRPRGIVWNHFQRDYYCPRKKRTEAKCLYCFALFDGRSEVLEHHILDECTKISHEVRQKYDEERSAALPDAAEVSGISKADRKRLRSLSKKGQSQTNLTNHFWKKENTSENEAQQIDQAILLLFVMCNISFATAGSIYFLNLIRKLNPYYMPPGTHHHYSSNVVLIVLLHRYACFSLLIATTPGNKVSFAHCAGPQKLSGQLLSEEALRLRAAFLTTFGACKYITLSIDGWTDVSNKSVYAICVVLDDEAQTPHLLAVVDLSADRHAWAFGSWQTSLPSASSTKTRVPKKTRGK
jgi:hypothetical protein